MTSGAGNPDDDAVVERGETHPEGGDGLLTVALLILMTIVGLFAALGSGLIRMQGACSPPECNPDMIMAGSWIAFVGPIVVVVVAFVLAIMRLVKRRRAWPVPLQGIAAILVTSFIGYCVAATA